ncbi:FAD-dependent oxidoreductase [Saccharomonospora sp. NPDC046836]|uniref:FAD-dependent oxidoreductase n=1 Tax=Saccharomonospora sp. NPDC046836 TaxID=3156921 RepID=UPI00340F526C
MPSASKPGWDEEYDVVCVGSGAGSVTAALVAAAAGARVLVVEKYHELGGVTALSAGQLWLGPSAHAARAGLPDSPDEVLAYLDFLSAGFGDLDNRGAYVARGGEVLEALAAHGLELQVIRGMADYYYPDAPGSKPEGRYLEVVPFSADRLGTWAERVVCHAGVSTGGIGGNRLSSMDHIECGGDSELLARRAAERTARSERAQGAGIAANLIALALDKGVEFRVNTKAVDLVGTDQVDGLLVEAGDRRIAIRTRSGVVLGMGGYDWAPELVEGFEYVRGMHSVTLPTVTGDHFRLGARLRAAIATTLPQGKGTHFGVHVPGETWGGKPMYRHMMPGLPHSLVVNQRGRRFGDESFFHSYVAAMYTFDGDRQEFPNWPAWFVFDDNFRRKYRLGPLSPGAPLPPGMARSATTLGELADLCEIDRAELTATVARFNAFSSTGVDEDFGRGNRPWSRTCLGDPTRQPNPNLGPVDRAPFHAIELGRVGTGLASAGLKTDASAQVHDVDGRLIPGLFAVGNTAARLEFGGGYNSGMAVGRSLVFGFAAGEVLAAAKPPRPTGVNQ